MKFLEAKQQRDAGENKMLGGPAENKGAEVPSTPTRPSVRPEVQELADTLGVDLSSTTGTGTNGSITRTDVRKAAQARDDAVNS